MRLLSLSLRNIRSYRAATMEFPEGITLLSGDIGAGKSTLLYAIEFALFGISRGELIGAALLRHGAADGSVQLTFSAAGHTYKILRTLKRNPNGVTQEAGWLETDDAREQLTPSELRARVYGILGYPLQFLAKQRNLIYRFTLYTPQEEMKAILEQSSEERLETVRRLFGVDAYRVARDNAHLVVKALKERENLEQAHLSRITQDETRLKERLLRVDALREQQTRLVHERDVLTQQVTLAEGDVTRSEEAKALIMHEQQIQAMQERNRKIALADLERMRVEHSRKEKLMRDAQDVVRKLRASVEIFTKELPAGVSIADAARLQEEIIVAQTELERLRQEEGKAIALMEHAHDPSIDAGAVCPTCKQTVTAVHLAEVKMHLAGQRSAAEKKRDTMRTRAKTQREAIDQLQSSLQVLRQIAEQSSRLSLQEKTAAGYGEDVAELARIIAAKQAEIATLPTTVDATLLERARKAEQRLLECKSVLQRVRQQSLDVERQLARLEQEAKDLAHAQEQLVLLGRERLEREERLSRDARVRGWLAQQFTPFASVVERHVLLAVHSSFDAAFRQWFSRLIEDDALSARVDHEFAPIMLQHGYETDVAFLSGGERTAVSLAYRLALVHTIHLLSPQLGTAGLLMLDEPTDGFSAEQLERVRDVLRELAMQQVILVSHEQQLEGFVDHILRVRRSGDGSIVELAV